VYQTKGGCASNCCNQAITLKTPGPRSPVSALAVVEHYNYERQHINF